MGLSAHDLQVWRGDRHVLRGLSLEAGPGQLVHVAGPNGAGKTTLLRTCAGLLTPEQGRVRWQGQPIAADRDAYAAAICYLGHSDGLKPDLTAQENLVYEAGLRRRLGTGEVDEALARVGLSASRCLPARALSAGQRRRLAFARVILARTTLWLLDEPFTNLDDAGVAMVAGIVADQVDGGGIVMFAAHHAPEIPRHRPRRLELG